MIYFILSSGEHANLYNEDYIALVGSAIFPNECFH